MVDTNKNILKKVIKQFESKNAVYERFSFYKRIQQKDEPFEVFLSDINRLVKTCKFGPAADSMIRDQIVIGILNHNLQTRLLNTDELDLSKAIEICRIAEKAEEHIKKAEKFLNICAQGDDFNSNKLVEYNLQQPKSSSPSTSKAIVKPVKPRKPECSNYAYLHKYGKSLAYGERCKLCKKIHTDFEMVSSKRDMNNGEESPKAILQDKDFILDCLCWHNEYRARHGAPALTVSPELCEYSQQWANHLASTNEFYYRAEKNMGQNIFCCPVSALVTDLTGQEVASYWYSTVRRYNYFKEAHLLHTNVNAGHFTQIAWIGSRYFGVGKASSKTGKIFVVAYYFPPGNIPGQFHENVLPPVMDQDNLPAPPPVDFDSNAIPSLLKNSLMNNNLSGGGSSGGGNNPSTSN